MNLMPQIMYELKEANRYLYHYTEARIAIDHILAARQLKIGCLARTNDPKESKTWSFSMGGVNLDKYDMKTMSEWLSRELKAKIRVACFCLDAEPLSGNHVTDILRRGYCKPRMWAQYAGRHSGICLVFDWHKLVSLFEARFSEPMIFAKGAVEYRDRSIIRSLSEQDFSLNLDHLEAVGESIYVRDHLSTHMRPLCFEKLSDWRNESEFRFMVFGEPGGDLFLEIGDSLSGLVFGDGTSEADMEKAMELTRSWGIDYLKIGWTNHAPWYEFGHPLLMPPPWGKRA